MGQQYIVYWGDFICFPILPRHSAQRARPRLKNRTGMGYNGKNSLNLWRNIKMYDFDKY